MPRWRVVPDPVSQVESRSVPFCHGVIHAVSVIDAFESLNKQLSAFDDERLRAFNELVEQYSLLFQSWKSTRRDFRFRDENKNVVATARHWSIAANKITFEMRVDRVGISNPKLIFDERVNEGSGYPGEWWRKYILDGAHAYHVVQLIRSALGK